MAASKLHNQRPKDKFNQTQRELIIRWLGQGLRSDDINALAAKENPPFSVTPDDVSYYRHTRKIDIQALIRESEQRALLEGLALRQNRLQALARLAKKLEEELYVRGSLWLLRVRG